MAFEILKKEGYTLVKVLAERLDTTIAPDLRSELVKINGKGEINIVLDLSSCSYCDASGMRAALVAQRLCNESIGTFILCGLQAQPEKLVRFSKLHHSLLVTNTVGEAEYLLNKKGEL
jgi:anti-sigma B factor antagonist